ncbi:MAG: hypothetical protein D6682_01475 [Zetaproteobacteria bacterium]|nr:MAG: hypothetical protein D6682_01475 [Zetaproteobacteria bacterium]
MRPSAWVLLRPGISRERLRRLGASRAERSIDLHGMGRAQALDLLQRELAEADRCRMRVIEVIHGRGLHSDGRPVLREALYHWLCAGPMGVRLLAAIPRPGSAGGATLLLLRRRRG